MDSTTANWVWGGLLAFGAAVEVAAIRNRKVGDTLSERTRAWFRINTRAGRLVFGTAWVGFAVWFLVHILNTPHS